MAHGGPSKRKSNNNIDDNDSEDELTVPPPDGGWGWVIVIASFLIHIISEYCTIYMSNIIFHFPLSYSSFHFFFFAYRRISETVRSFNDFFFPQLIVYTCVILVQYKKNHWRVFINWFELWAFPCRGIYNSRIQHKLSISINICALSCVQCHFLMWIKQEFPITLELWWFETNFQFQL